MALETTILAHSLIKPQEAYHDKQPKKRNSMPDVCFAFMTIDTYTSLTERQIKDFHQKGYVILRKFYSEEEVAEMQESQSNLVKTANALGKGITKEREEQKIMANGTQYVLERIGKETKINRFVWVGAQEPVLTGIGRRTNILAIMHQLLGTKQAYDIIRSLHLKQWFKNEKDRLKLIPHKDIGNRIAFSHLWKEVADEEIGKYVSYVAMCVAIQSMHENNGPLEIISGIPVDEKNRPINLQLKSKNLKTAERMTYKYGKWEKIILNPGDVIVQHPYLIHKSGITQVNDPLNQRGLLIIGMCRSDANPGVYPGEGSGQLIDLVPVAAEGNDDQ